MMKKFYGKVRRAVGFTMAEVLIVVAILAILLTLAMPNVLAYFRGLRLTELDDNARTIFLAAQNRLTALINSGEADDLKGTPVDSAPGVGGDPVTPAAPAGLFMLSSEDADAMSLLLPAGSIESSLTSGHYVIYYFPNSGAVYSVWYCDKDGEWEEYTQHTDKDDRLKQSVLVGYYGDSGDRVIDRAEVGQLPIPKVTLTNAEELVLDIEMTFEGTEIDPTKTTLEVKISSDSVPGGVTLLKATFGAGDPAHKAAIVLDTLKDGYKEPVTDGRQLTGAENFGGQFKDIVADTGIDPGEDITVTVKVSYTPGADGKQFTPQTVTVTGNSLFASVSTDPATGDKTANIAYGRHLQNLDTDISGVTGITAAVQVREIDFAKADGVEIESWQATYGNRSFIPIENGELSLYDGKKLPIRNMTAGDASTVNAGLFGEVKGGEGSPVKLTDIVLVDCAAAATVNVGTLAGTAEKVAVTGCEVYLENKKAGKAEDGTLVILLDGGTVGGLIGRANGECTVTSSFASTNMHGADVGGLIGAGIAVIDRCYAAGYLTGTGNVGGLVGNADTASEADAVKVTDSYAAGIIAGGAAVNGLSGGSAERCYSAVRYGSEVTNVTLGADVYFIKQSGVTYEGGKSRTADELKDEFIDGAWYTPVNPAYAVFPYKQTADTESLIPSYPYPMLKNVSEGKEMPVLHYGDWLVEEEKINGYFAYYEEYEGGTYGFHTNYSPLGGTDTPFDKLSDGIVVKDGYAFVSTETIDSLEVTVGSTSYTLNSPKEYTVDGTKYYIYELLYDAIENVQPINGYYNVIIGGNTYKFNPHFACEAWDESVLKINTDHIKVRTARQLANVSMYTNDDTLGIYAKAWHYVQELDIDFAVYTGWSEFTAGRDDSHRMSGAVLTGGSYKGNGHFIKNLYLSGGLFSSVTDGGTLENIRLVNVSVTGTGTVGGLADKLDGSTVTDCGIYAEDAEDYDIFTVASGSDNSSYAGGLIGTASNNSKISKSFAAVRVSGAKAGGFACELNGVTVTDCYSGGHTVNGIYDKDAPNVSCTGTGSNGKAGGFAVTATGTTFNGICYSTCSVGDGSNSSNLKDAALFAGDGGNNVVATGAELYALGKAFKKDGTEFSAADIKDITNVKTGASVPRAAGNILAVPYDTALGNVYPYDSNLTEHHGDWPGSAIVGFFYSEKEGDAYNFYILLWEKGEADADWHALGDPNNTAPTLIDTLCYEYHGIDDVPAITETGYGYFSITIHGSTVDFSGTGTGTANESIKTALMSALEKNTTRSFTGYDFKAYSIGGSGSNRNMTAVMNGTEISVDVNVDFAAMIATASGQAWKLGAPDATIIPASSGDFGSADTHYNVRTLTQLKKIADNTYVGSNKVFKQEHDLDADSVTDFKPIGTQDRAFNGTYDGDGYRILELSIEATGYAGLFGVADGATIKNVIMFSNGANISAQMENHQSWWGFVSENNASVGVILGGGNSVTISNCAAAGYNLSATIPNGLSFINVTSIRIGCIAGQLTGSSKILSCETCVDIEGTFNIYSFIPSANVYCGGIVGEISGTGNTISNSCSGGKIEVNVHNITKHIGGIAGSAGSRTTISKCYTYMTGLDYAIEGSGNAVTNCMYLCNATGNNSGAQKAVILAELRDWANNNGYEDPDVVNGGAATSVQKQNTLAIVNVNYKYENGTRTSGFVFYGELPSNG